MAGITALRCGNMVSRQLMTGVTGTKDFIVVDSKRWIPVSGGMTGFAHVSHIDVARRCKVTVAAGAKNFRVINLINR